MTLAQTVATLGPDAEGWKAVAEALATILLGILGFIGQRVIRTLDQMGKDMKEWGVKIHRWNETNQRAVSTLGTRLSILEDRE